jgi:hypothetical protein
MEKTGQDFSGNKGTVRRKEKRELAPISCTLILTAISATSVCLCLKIYLWYAVVYDLAVWITVALMNRTWLYRHKRRLGAEAARINLSNLKKSYESDYTKKDKYISQRLLAALDQEQVPDTTGAMIYAVGRMRTAELVEELRQEVAELQEETTSLQAKCESLEWKLGDATRTAREAAEMERDARRELKAAQQRQSAAETAQKQAEQERDRAIREFEREVVGYNQSEQEADERRWLELEKKVGNMNQELLASAGISHKEAIESVDKMVAFTKQPKSEKSISEYQRKDIIYKLQNGYKQKEVAELYGISQGTVSKIKKASGEFQCQ